MERIDQRESEFEILTLKPRWSLRGMVFERSPVENKNSIMLQLKGHYISQGWKIADIGWAKRHRFAVVKLEKPSFI